jgi:predicted metal-dependent enzyme (double-stranded beta helix superfamily)
VNPIHPALAPLARAAKEMPYQDVAPVLKQALAERSWLRAEHRVGDPTRYMRHVLYVDPMARSS